MGLSDCRPHEGDRPSLEGRGKLGKLKTYVCRAAELRPLQANKFMVVDEAGSSRDTSSHYWSSQLTTEGICYVGVY